MKLARRMVLSSRIPMMLAKRMARMMVLPGILLSLICELITLNISGDNLNIPRNIKRDQIMLIIIEKRVVSSLYRKWQRHLQTGDVPRELKNWFPRLMLMTKNQRARCIPSLIEMQLLSKVVFNPQNLRVLRTVFRGMYASGDSFAIEFNSHDSRILVLKIWCNAGKVMMKAELHDRLDGLIDASNEQQIDLNLDLSMHTIDLNFVINRLIPLNQTGARLFYTRNVSLPLKRSSESFDRSFDLETYESVRFYKEPEGQKPEGQKPEGQKPEGQKPEGQKPKKKRRNE
jgi:hypothetical protein